MSWPSAPPLIVGPIYLTKVDTTTNSLHVLYFSALHEYCINNHWRLRRIFGTNIPVLAENVGRVVGNAYGDDIETDIENEHENDESGGDYGGMRKAIKMTVGYNGGLWNGRRIM